MPQDAIKKLYFSIGEVSEMTGLDQHVLRYWEGEFDQLRPKKNRAGRRVYTQEDVQTVLHVQHLLRDEKYTIEGARQVLAREANARRTGRPPVGVLRDLKQFLLDLRSRL